MSRLYQATKPVTHERELDQFLFLDIPSDDLAAPDIHDQVQVEEAADRRGVTAAQ